MIEGAEVREPALEIRDATDVPRALVILLPGGAERGHGRLWRGSPAYLRMLPFQRALPADVTVWRLRYRLRGWNGPAADPVRDLAWALDRARERHPRLPVILIGHSMGGRAALWGAGDPQVTAVCALAPWIEPGDPVGQLAGRTVLIAHGDHDRITDPAASRRYAAAAERAGGHVTFLSVAGDGHGMLRRARYWHRLVGGFVAARTPRPSTAPTA
ncbi:alpha/beta hydrolase [Catellatospora methionotrophica]|uniref:Alpha/beta hydrolase n=1 Tax=Catellatospora methionotrophica TaxID=121620 RepID=A0A8J3LNM6_9ACTN|nr:alpha/beta fold hydrolase [Catellatospora methionotrophica]GIG18879.1 alpha/beta hydrolase [Catellatospora methionotrophica]